MSPAPTSTTGSGVAAGDDCGAADRPEAKARSMASAARSKSAGEFGEHAITATTSPHASASATSAPLGRPEAFLHDAAHLAHRADVPPVVGQEGHAGVA